MTYVLEIEIEGLPPQNSSDGTNRWARRKERIDWIERTLKAIGTNIPPKPLKKAKVWYTRYSSSEPDFTNCAQGFKHPEDALVQAGVIIDDKMSVIGSPTVRWVKCPPNQGKITIRVEEA